MQSYIHHRQAREVSILRRLAKGDTDIATLVRAIYIGIDPRLTSAAGTVRPRASRRSGHTRRRRDGRQHRARWRLPSLALD